MEKPLVLLAIDDDPDSLELIRSALSQPGLEIYTEEDPERGLELVEQLQPQIVLVDLMMPKLSGMDILDRTLQTAPNTDVILLTAHYSTETAVEAIRSGACDYVTKPLDIDGLSARIDTLMKEAHERAKAVLLDRELVQAYQFEGIIGRSAYMLEVFALIRRIAPHFRTTLVTGSTGTGKELVARALYRLSPVSSGPFIVLNCSAITETLFESEFFGHVKGAFTGATHDKQGLLEAANGGVLFLDEIGDMPLAAQAKLLRAIQEQELTRVGSTSLRKLNVRVVAATNRDLVAMVAQKQFREDLYFRLSMAEIRLPDLIGRREDLPLLLRHYVERYATEYGKNIIGLSRSADALLSRHHWPGNVREVQNVIGYACMAAEGERIDVADLPAYVRGGAPESAFEELQSDLVSLEVAAQRHARRVLKLVGGNKARAAEILGVSRTTLYRLLRPGSAELSIN
jgi:DNA-binding NtrC family response regulator